MFVMFAVGEQSQAIINTLKKQADDLDFKTYSSVSLMVSEANLRHLSFDRIVFTSKFLGPDIDSQLRELSSFISNSSDRTEVVMILRKGIDEELERTFLKYFNSPMYSPAYVTRPNPAFMLDVIKSSMSDVKARYYSLDKQVDYEPATKKKPTISAFSGGVKKTYEQQENSTEESNDIQDLSDTGKIAKDSDAKISNNESSFKVQDSGNTLKDEESYESGKIENPLFINNSSVPVGTVDSDSEDSDFIDDEDELSIGAFGDSHSDTGLFDDEDDAEVIARARQGLKTDISVKKHMGIEQVKVEKEGQEKVEQKPSSGEEPKKVSTTHPRKPVDKEEFMQSKDPVVQTIQTTVRESIPKDLGFYIITGLSGSGCTQYAVDEAVKQAQNGKRVLLIDFDEKTHGMLSFLDVNKFYADGCYKRKIYIEDNVNILSNGYGGKITEDDLSYLLAERVLTGTRGYDCVYIDCPLEVISKLSDYLQDFHQVILCVYGDQSKFIETEYFMQEFVDQRVRYKISRYAKIHVFGQDLDLKEINSIRKNVLFTDYCWLSNARI